MPTRTKTLTETPPARARDDGTITSEGPRRGLVLLSSRAPYEGDGAFAAESELVIGRDAGCSVFIVDDALSRSHATVGFRGRGPSAVVTDVSSHNGTFVDGRRIDRPTPASAGSLIRCGQSLFMVVKDVAAFAGWRDANGGRRLVGGPKISALLRELGTFAPSACQVLITGERGSGKDLIAQELHRRSERPGKIIDVNCSAIPPTLFEAEMFGAVKGAYTGAIRTTNGYFQEATNGTLFLDEVGDLPHEMQAKLLRVVEQQRVGRVGERVSGSIDVRVISATNVDLRLAVEEGRFRADLFDRLCGVELRVPPLRDRPEDIPLLVEHWLGASDSWRNLTPKASFMETLVLNRWPGNVRVLEQVVAEACTRAVAEGTAELRRAHLPASLRRVDPVADIERERIVSALIECGGNVSKAAKQYGRSRSAFNRLANHHGIDPDDYR